MYKQVRTFLRVPDSRALLGLLCVACYTFMEPYVHLLVHCQSVNVIETDGRGWPSILG